ncbi:hypothetical protein BH23GEM10_BH23GEM10_03910 [soil metagenome]
MARPIARNRGIEVYGVNDLRKSAKGTEARSANRYRAVRLLIVATLVLTSAGCAHVFGTYGTAPNGLATGEDRLRQLLSSGRPGTAVERFDRDAPDDDVLRALYQGVLAYHAGDYAGSAAILDVAGEMADDRITKSVSRSALSIVSNDLVLPYEPGPTERLMIPYYAALARTRMGDVSGAAVEARRLSMLLQRYRDDDVGVDAPLAATLHLLAGAMFEANGNAGDADVAFRNASALDATLAGGARAAGAGSVFVIVEQGFIAHRVEQGLAVMLRPEEVHAIAHGEAGDRAAASAYVAGRVLERAAHSISYSDGRRYHNSTLYVPAPDHTDLPSRRTRTVCTTVENGEAGDSLSRPSTRRECTERDEDIDDLPYLLKVAWPVYRSEFRPASELRLIGASTGPLPFATSAELSRGVIRDFERERALIIARTIARGTVKLAVTKGAERKIEEQNEVAARIVGLLGNIGSALLERADTRSWHLLPAGLAVTRVDLPAGTHDMHIAIGGRTVAIVATVESGRTNILPVRVW